MVLSFLLVYLTLVLSTILHHSLVKFFSCSCLHICYHNKYSSSCLSCTSCVFALRSCVLVFESYNFVLFLVWKLDLYLLFNLCSCDSSWPWQILFLLIGEVFVFERLFFLGYHILRHLIMGDNCQNHVDNIFFLKCSCRYLFLKHRLSYVFMKMVVDFMFNKIVDEATGNDGTNLFIYPWPFLLLDLFHVPPPIWVKIPFNVASFLFLSLLFGLFRF